MDVRSLTVSSGAEGVGGVGVGEGRVCKIVEDDELETLLARISMSFGPTQGSHIILSATTLLSAGPGDLSSHPCHGRR